MKELERENRELKEMLAGSLLKNRVLEGPYTKNCKPGPSAGGGTSRGGRRALFATAGLPVSQLTRSTYHLSGSSVNSGGTVVEEKVA